MKKFYFITVFVLVSCAGQKAQRPKRIEVIYNHLIYEEIQKGNIVKADSLIRERNKKITTFTKS